jgi:hypothetical protein
VKILFFARENFEVSGGKEELGWFGTRLVGIMSAIIYSRCREESELVEEILERERPRGIELERKEILRR